MEAFHPRLRFVNSSGCLPRDNRTTAAEINLNSLLFWGRHTSTLTAAVRGNGASLTDFFVSCRRWLRLAHAATEASCNRCGNGALTFSHSAVKTWNHSGVHGDDKGNLRVLTRQRVAAVINLSLCKLLLLKCLCLKAVAMPSSNVTLPPRTFS